MRVAWLGFRVRSLLAALLSLDIFVSVSSIKCLQCMSMKDTGCESGNYAATQCHNRTRFCVKFTVDEDLTCLVGRQADCGGFMVLAVAWSAVWFSTGFGYVIYFYLSNGLIFRKCASEENYGCRHVTVENRKYHACFHTCYTDGCNTAVTLTTHTTIAITMSVALTFILLTCSFSLSDLND